MIAFSADTDRWVSLVRSIADPVVATDDAGVITLLNPAAEQLLAVSAAQALGQPLDKVNPALGQWWERVVREASAAPARRELKWGQDQYYSVSLTPLPDQGRPAAGWVAVLHDVTLLKQVEQAKSDAIQSAVHDLRNPLNLIAGSLNLLRDLLPDPTPEQTECLSMIQYNADRMAALTDELLRQEEGEVTAGLRLVPLSLRSVMQDAVGDFRAAAEQKGLRLQFYAPLVSVDVLGDEAWLNRAAANLLSNAVKYTPRGGHVTVRCSEVEGEAVVEVTDTGPGIAPTDQARLFERHYRASGEATRHTPGSGLGLAIVKTIIEKHGGRVWVSSEVGKGSTFGFALPQKT